MRACSIQRRISAKLPAWSYAAWQPDWSADCRCQAHSTLCARHSGVYSSVRLTSANPRPRFDQTALHPTPRASESDLQPLPLHSHPTSLNTTPPSHLSACSPEFTTEPSRQHYSIHTYCPCCTHHTQPRITTPHPLSNFVHKARNYFTYILRAFLLSHSPFLQNSAGFALFFLSIFRVSVFLYLDFCFCTLGGRWFLQV